MKALLGFAVTLCLFIGSTGFAAEPEKFVIVTKAFRWNDGAESNVGRIEGVVAETPASFVLWAPDGTKYEIPRENVREISATEAARLLLARFQQAEAQFDAAKSVAQNQSTPTQNNGRPLPKNWIDPKQADANFQAEQTRRELNRQTQELQRLQQQLQNQRR